MGTKIQTQEVMQLREEMESLFPEKWTEEYFRLPISKGLFAVIDACKREAVLSLGGTWQAQLTVGGVYACKYIAGRKMYLHDFLTNEVHTGFLNKLTLDCRLKNLFSGGRRAVMQNRRGKRGTSSKFKNVHLKNGEDRWRVSLKSHDLGRVNFGRYHDEIEAAKVADAAALSLFGPHAFLNFPDLSVANHALLVQRYITRRRERLAKREMESSG